MNTIQDDDNKPNGGAEAQTESVEADGHAHLKASSLVADCWFCEC